MRLLTPLVAVFGLALLGIGTPAGAAPLKYWPASARHDHGSTARTLQLFLQARGYPVAADGIFGRATQSALRRFQHARQLVAGGETNVPTWEALVVPVRQGGRGPAVRAAQLLLREQGYAVAADGAFGPQMKAQVQRFQKQTEHTTDGVIGRNTWYELLGGNGTGD